MAESSNTLVFIARCPEHGLHGERTHCYECGREAEQVPMVPAAERDRLRETLESIAAGAGNGRPALDAAQAMNIAREALDA